MICSYYNLKKFFFLKGHVRYLTNGAGSNNISSVLNGTLKPPGRYTPESFFFFFHKI